MRTVAFIKENTLTEWKGFFAILAPKCDKVIEKLKMDEKCQISLVLIVETES